MDSNQYEFNGIYWRHKRVHVPKDTKIGPGSVIGAYPLKTDFKKGKRYRVPINGSIAFGKNVDIGAGVIINLGVEDNTFLDNNTWIGHHSTIGHDCVIREGSVVGVGCNICGEVYIGENCYIAAGTTIQPKATICSGSMVGTESNVITKKVIPAKKIAYGNPCKVIKENEWEPPHP